MCELILVGPVVLQRQMVIRQSRTGHIRFWIELQQPARDRAQSIRRNDVARKRLIGVGIPDDDRCARKVSVAHGDRRGVVQNLLLLSQPESLVVRHEEQLIPAVEQPGNLHRSPEREAELIPLEGSGLGAHAGKGIRSRIERVVANEFEDRPVILIRSALGGDVHLRRLATEFSRIHAGLDLEFLHAIDRGQERVGVEVDVLIDDAVERVVVVFAALTGDRKVLRRAIAPLPAAGATAAAARVIRAHVLAQRHQVDEVAPVERQLEDLLVVDDRSNGSIGDVDHRCAAGDLHGHLHGTQLQGEIETGRLLHLQFDSVKDFALKALQVHSDVVHTRQQVRKHVATSRVGLGFTGRVGLGVRDHHGGPNKDASARVCDGARDLPEGLSK